MFLARVGWKDNKKVSFKDKIKSRYFDLTYRKFLFERVRTIICIVSLVVCSACAGSALGANFLLTPRTHVHVSPALVAVKSLPNVHPEFQEQQLTTQTAINSLQIEQVIKQNQVSIDDRQNLHSLIQAEAASEVNHYNVITDRLNVSDARVITIGWILGILFTLSQAVVVFFHLDGKRMRRLTE